MLAAGIAAAVLATRPSRPGPPGAGEPPAPAAPVPAPAAEAPAARWLDEVEGVEAADLDAARLALFLRIANGRACTCACGYTIAECRAFDPDCDQSLPLARAALDSLRAGLVPDTAGLRAPPAAAVRTRPPAVTPGG